MLTPLTRETLRNIRANHSEQMRLSRIQNIIRLIYTDAVRAATEGHTLYRYELPTSEFYTANAKDIVLGLQQLFLKCDVEHKNLTLGDCRNGTTLEVREMDRERLLMLRRIRNESCIVIDWT